MQSPSRRIWRASAVSLVPQYGVSAENSLLARARRRKLRIDDRCQLAIMDLIGIKRQITPNDAGAAQAGGDHTVQQHISAPGIARGQQQVGARWNGPGLTGFQHSV